MSVETTADKNLSEAKKHLNEACKELTSFINDETWGHNEYNANFIDDVTNILIELLKLKKILNS